MADSKVAESVADALGRAQTFAFTTLTTALIVGYIALTNLAELHAELGRLQQERAKLTDIANRSDNALREIRRYILLRLPGESDAPAIRQVMAATASAQDYANTVSQRLVDINSSFDQVLAINKLLLPLRVRGQGIVSVNVDFSPQSLSVFDRLELFRLRDIAVLAHLISSDPLKMSKALKPFFVASNPSPESIDGLRKNLEAADADVAKEMLDQTAIIGEELRKAVEQYGVQHGALAIGSLASSYAETIGRVRALEERERAIHSSLRGDFDVKVPFLDQTAPVRLVVGFFPVGLIIGYGMVVVALAFAQRQLEKIAAAARQDAANVGSIFDQLRKESRPSRFLNWFLVLVVLCVPLLVALIVICQYAATMSGMMTFAISVLLFCASIFVFVIMRQALLISTEAK